ncbi:hypothetical protein ACM26V_04735 [Salipaludibacillus sp. HK11]|uniref:hypothetical protein n=1 Tax=Salipaludibacillus sp. HK11 TaxID=3394320 RepID=UPI0039FC9FEA
MDNKKEELIKVLKKQLKDGEKVTFELNAFEYRDLESNKYFLLKDGFLCEYINDNFNRRVEVNELEKILDKIAVNKLKNKEQLDDVKNFLDI